MENASKALTMAGSVLIALMVIALFVAAYQSLSQNEKYKQNSTEVVQATEFNKPFEAYNDNDSLHGVDALSVANMILDYNKKYPDEGYDEIKLKVTLVLHTYESNQFFKVQCYDQSLLISTFSHANAEVDSLESKKYPNGKTISYFADMRTAQIDAIKAKYPDKQSDFSDLEQRKASYLNVTGELSNFKTRKFKCKITRYNDDNGRVKEINFEEYI